MLIPIDIETTGLDYENDEVLEIAWCITDNKLVQLTPERSLLISSAHWGRTLEKMHADEFVYKMHWDSGLLTDLANVRALARTDMTDVGIMVGQDIERARKITEDDSAPMLLGNSVHFDKRFIERDLPDLDLHHRIYDVSTLNTLADSLGIIRDKQVGTKHRALDDMRYSLSQARAYRDLALEAMGAR